MKTAITGFVTSETTEVRENLQSHSQGKEMNTVVIRPCLSRIKQFPS